MNTCLSLLVSHRSTGFIKTFHIVSRHKKVCGINLLAQIKAALGDLDKVVRVVKLNGYVNSSPDFIDAPKVINGASDLMVAAFGDKGRHARAAVGVASLPADAAVEVEGVFEVS